MSVDVLFVPQLSVVVEDSLADMIHEYKNSTADFRKTVDKLQENVSLHSRMFADRSLSQHPAALLTHCTLTTCCNTGRDPEGSIALSQWDLSMSFWIILE